jgi:hypothetical protein
MKNFQLGKNTYRLKKFSRSTAPKLVLGENKQTNSPPPSHLTSRHRYSRIGIQCVVVILYPGTTPVVSVGLVYPKAAVFEKTGVKLYDAVLSSVKKT